MGSSKKKDRDRKKRKRERSSSRTRTKDRKEKHHRHHHHKHKKHKRTREERSPSISLSDLSDLEIDHAVQKPAVEPVKYIPPPLPPLNQPPPEPVYVVSGEISPPPSPPSFANGAAPMQGGKEISLSIEETNRIRAKLGMKPLQVSADVKTSQDEDTVDKVYVPGQEIHKPAENIRDKIQVEKLREKIAAQKEKRLQKEKMKKVKGLGDPDDEIENLNEWVKKSRKMEQARKEAEKRNKMLEELDAQFGIGELVDEEMTQTKKRLYNSGDLSGLRVQHGVDRFSEGQTTILTLKDSNILDGNEDTLVNVNIEDTERVETNLKRKKAKKDDSEYEAPEVDEFGDIVQNSVLTKYDEEIEGERKKSFRIGRRGEGFDESEESSSARGGAQPQQALDRKRKMLQLRREVTSLDTPAHQLATEYLTQEESVSFKKVKKKKRKKKMLTADDLEPIDDGEVHLGSRKVFGSVQDEQPMDWEGVKGDSEGSVKREIAPSKRVKSLRELMEEDEEDAPKEEKPDEVQETPEDESEAEKEAIELQEALKRSRRAKQLKKVSSEAMTDALVASSTGRSRQPKSSAIPLPPTDMANMTLNLTDEFCRSLGDIPTYGLSGNRAEDEAILLSESPQKASGEAWDTQGGAWEEVGIETTKVEIASERNIPILEEEPDTGKGIVNALKLASKKGYLEKGGDKKPVNATLQHLRAVHYSIEDKTVEDDRRGGRGGGDRYMGPSIDFKEKDLYRPDVKLEYVDDEGRKLNAKEAFRYLSHKFHGKGSGKNKLEKRMKKWQEELLMKHMSSSDTPLQTLEKQKEKQKKLGAAYLVLSGSKTQETLDVKK